MMMSVVDQPTRHEVIVGAWYPLGAMRRRRVTVRLMLDGGSWHVEAHVAPHQGRDMWLEKVRGGGDVVTPLAVYGSPRTLDGKTLDAWQPLVSSIWPDPLPEPMHPAFTRPRPPDPEPEPKDAHVHTDEWPYPGLALGVAPDLPRTAIECEARVLRAIRTERHPGVVTGIRPRGYVDSIVAVSRGQIVGDYKDVSAVGAVVTPFQPTRRDLTDWDTALTWLARLGRGDQRLIMMRADNPPWSYTQISKAFGISPTMARKRYVGACAEMFRATKRGK